MSIFNRFLSIIYHTLIKTGNLDPPSGTTIFTSVIIGLNAACIVDLILIAINTYSIISKEVHYILTFSICFATYLLINKIFKRTQSEIINYKVSKEEYIYAFLFVFILIGTIILMSNYTRSIFLGG